MPFWRFRDWFHRQPERISIWIANHLPKSIVYWAAIRVAVHATTGKWSKQNVPSLTIDEMLSRWFQ